MNPIGTAVHAPCSIRCLHCLTCTVKLRVSCRRLRWHCRPRCCRLLLAGAQPHGGRAWMTTRWLPVVSVQQLRASCVSSARLPTWRQMQQRLIDHALDTTHLARMRALLGPLPLTLLAHSPVAAAFFDACGELLSGAHRPRSLKARLASAGALQDEEVGTDFKPLASPWGDSVR